MNTNNYKLYIFSNQALPYADIYDSEGKLIAQFKPIDTLRNDIATIEKANEIMKSKNLPLFDVKHYSMYGDNRSRYYHTI
jgi:hypothetical protein